MKLKARERDTVIAALRFWQTFITGQPCDAIALWEIAANEREGEDARLSVEEIDDLIENKVNK